MDGQNNPRGELLVTHLYFQIKDEAQVVKRILLSGNLIKWGFYKTPVYLNPVKRWYSMEPRTSKS